jgi:NB-ARC domain
MKRPNSIQKCHILRASQALGGHYFSLGFHPFLYTVLYTVSASISVGNEDMGIEKARHEFEIRKNREGFANESTKLKATAMDKTTATLVALGIVALVVLAFFAVFRRRGKFRIKAPLVEVSAEGENTSPIPPAMPTDSAFVKAENISAGHNVTIGKEVHVQELSTEKTEINEVGAGATVIVAKTGAIVSVQPGQLPPKSGLAPPMPSLVVGREEALRELKSRLGVTDKKQEGARIQILTALRGLPGVGKTTIAAALAHDPDVQKVFPDGILWTSLGQRPELLSELATWGRALGSDELLHCRDLQEATTRMSGLLRNKRMLLIVDDAWEAKHVIPFKVGGVGCAMLVTTRETGLAKAIAPTDADIYMLEVLTDEKALELLKLLAPSVVVQFSDQALELVRELEGLPLGIQVAGRMLNVEASYGFGVRELLADLRAGKKLLEAQAPADRADLAKETIPTVAVLLQKSTDRLDPETRERYAYLAAFAPKPATFDLRAMKAVWEAEDPKPTVRILVDRGLLELVGETGRYQMHALLVLHAKSLCSHE